MTQTIAGKPMTVRLAAAEAKQVGTLDIQTGRTWPIVRVKAWGENAEAAILDAINMLGREGFSIFGTESVRRLPGESRQWSVQISVEWFR